MTTYVDDVFAQSQIMHYEAELNEILVSVSAISISAKIAKFPVKFGDLKSYKQAQIMYNF